MSTTASQDALPLKYFSLVFALSVPLWLVGGARLPIPFTLPVSSLAFFNPLIAASILRYRQQGPKGISDLLKKAFDFHRIKDKSWYAPIILLNPLIMVLSYAAMRVSGLPLPEPLIPLQQVPVLFSVFFIAGATEELGWMGYAIEPMQNRWGALKASLVLGTFWAIWHVIPDMQVGRTATWIVWNRLGTVATRVLMVWIFNNTGKSVFGAILYHDMNSLSWALFPNYGSHYNPFVTTVITGLTAAIVAIRSGPRTLARRVS